MFSKGSSIDSSSWKPSLDLKLDLHQSHSRPISHSLTIRSPRPTRHRSAQMVLPRLIGSYNSALLHRPLRTQVLTSLILFGGGDLIAQQAIERKRNQHDWARTARMAGYGAFVFAPLGTRWFKTLDFIRLKSHGLSTFLKLSIDQLIAAPTMLAFFFTTMNYLEGNDMKQAEERLREKWGPTLYKNWMVFGPLQAMNFALVPSHLRLLVLNGASLFWNSYLSYANASHIPIVSPMSEHPEPNHFPS